MWGWKWTYNDEYIEVENDPETIYNDYTGNFAVNLLYTTEKALKALKNVLLNSKKYRLNPKTRIWYICLLKFVGFTQSIGPERIYLKLCLLVSFLGFKDALIY